MLCIQCLLTYFCKPQEGEPPIKYRLSLKFAFRTRSQSVEHCPICNETVKLAPIEIWPIKSVVQQIEEAQKLGWEAGQLEGVIKERQRLKEVTSWILDTLCGMVSFYSPIRNRSKCSSNPLKEESPTRKCC